MAALDIAIVFKFTSRAGTGSGYVASQLGTARHEAALAESDLLLSKQHLDEKSHQFWQFMPIEPSYVLNNLGETDLITVRKKVPKRMFIVHA